MKKPEQNEMGVCAVCHRLIRGWVYTQWNGAEDDVLDWGWSHLRHPEDEHDAEPESLA